MKILQWNILYKEDINNIVKELKRIDSDIVCIQELYLINEYNSKINALKEIYPYVYYEVADILQDGGKQCNAILSK